MKKRFNYLWRSAFSVLVLILLTCVFPIWIAIWLIWEWDYEIWMNKFIDPEWAKSMNLTKEEWKEVGAYMKAQRRRN